MNDELTCAEVEALVPAYVFNAIDGDEACAFARHVVECRLHDADLLTERETTTRLAGVIDPVAPPQRLRASLLDAFEREVAGATQGESQPVPLRRRSPIELLRAPTFAYGLAAALVVLAVGLGAWGLSRGGSSQGSVAGAHLARSNSNGLRLDVTYLPSQKVAVLDVDLPTPPTGKTYQAWQISAGQPVSLGLLGSSGSTVFQANLAKASAVAITLEPAGGSPKPTVAPLIVSQF